MMYTLHLSARRVTVILFVIVTCLLLGGLTTQYIKYVHGHDVQWGLVRLLNLDGENNLPSWYSSVSLLLCSAILAIIGLERKQDARPYARHWLALAIIFLCLSLDEAASIHEETDRLVTQLLDATAYLDSFLPVIGMAWVLAGIFFAAIVFLTFWRFLLHLPVATRRLFLIAGGLYVAGAIGLEALAGRLTQHRMPTLTIEVMSAVEEGLEMVGVVVFLYALMAYMETHRIGLQLLIDKSRFRETGQRLKGKEVPQAGYRKRLEAAAKLPRLFLRVLMDV